MYQEQLRLTGKVAIVTGGSRGIGKEVALALAEAGAQVVITARRLPELEETAQQISRLGKPCLPVQGHLGSREDRERLVAQVRRELGRIDILVNNAATNTHYGPAIEVTEEAWSKILEVNLTGQLFLTKLVYPIMKEQGGGSIINIASEGGISPYPNIGIYGVTKAGLIMLTRVLARELGQDNIRVNAVAPGWVQTRFSRIVWENPADLETVLKHTATGRLTQAEDVVGAVLLLASDLGRQINGQVITISGGFWV